MKKLLALVLICSAGCAPKLQVLNSEQTTKAIMALVEHQNDLAKKHNALAERVVKLEPTPKAKAAK